MGPTGTTSSGPPYLTSAGQIEDEPDREGWGLDAEVDLGLDEEDSDDEAITAPLPHRDSPDDLIKDAPTINIEGKASNVYSSIKSTAQAIDVGLSELRAFLLNNADMAEISEYHDKFYTTTMKANAGSQSRGNAHPMDAVVARVVSYETSKLISPYRAPSANKRQQFEPIDHLAYSVYRMHDMLDDAGLLHVQWDAKSRYTAAFLVLKAREFLDNNPRKLQQAQSAQQKDDESATAKRRTQIEKRSKNASRTAAQPSITDGRLPPRSRGSKGSKISQRSQPLAHTEASDTEASGSRAPVRPIPATSAETMAILDEEVKRHQENDPDEKARRARATELGRQTIHDHVARLAQDTDRKAAYRTVQTLVRNSVVDFFDDFTAVDVSEYREKALRAFADGKPTPESVQNNDLKRTLDLSSAEKDQQKIDKVAELSATWAGEQARLIDANAERADLKPNDDLPPPSQAYKDMARDWSQMINSLEYQDERLNAALTACFIEDIGAMRVPGQCAGMRLLWWQTIAVAWGEWIAKRFGKETKINGHTGWTKGGLVGDEIGLGKTVEYGAAILLVSAHISSISFARLLGVLRMTSPQPPYCRMRRGCC